MHVALCFAFVGVRGYRLMRLRCMPLRVSMVTRIPCTTFTQTFLFHVRATANNIGCDGARHLGTALDQNTSLTKLDLSSM